MYTLRQFSTDPATNQTVSFKAIWTQQIVDFVVTGQFWMQLPNKEKERVGVVLNTDRVEITIPRGVLLHWEFMKSWHGAVVYLASVDGVALPPFSSCSTSPIEREGLWITDAHRIRLMVYKLDSSFSYQEIIDMMSEPAINLMSRCDKLGELLIDIIVRG